METIAKPVIKNKFWIVEQSGHKIATIQAVDENGGFVYVHDDQREHFPSIKLISKKYNIEFVKAEKPQKIIDNDVYGFPVSGSAHNQVLMYKDTCLSIPKVPKVKVSFVQVTT